MSTKTYCDICEEVTGQAMHWESFDPDIIYRNTKVMVAVKVQSSAKGQSIDLCSECAKGAVAQALGLKQKGTSIETR